MSFASRSVKGSPKLFSKHPPMTHQQAHDANELQCPPHSLQATANAIPDRDCGVDGWMDGWIALRTLGSENEWGEGGSQLSLSTPIPITPTPYAHIPAH